MVNSDLNSIRILANSDLIFISTLTYSDLIFISTLANSGLDPVVKVRIDFGPNCPRSELTIAEVRIRSELTKVRIVQGPNCPTFLLSKEEYAIKKTVMVVRCELKIPSLWITVRHHSASFVMPNSYHHHGIFNLHLTTIKGSYLLYGKIIQKIHTSLFEKAARGPKSMLYTLSTVYIIYEKNRMEAKLSANDNI